MDISTFITTYGQLIFLAIAGIVAWADLRSTSRDHTEDISEIVEEIRTIKENHMAFKDGITQSINLIQQDIREIMTILKQNK